MKGTMLDRLAGAMKTLSKRQEPEDFSMGDIQGNEHSAAREDI